MLMFLTAKKEGSFIFTGDMIGRLNQLNFTFLKPQQRTVRAALSNTFGFGGHNACVIVKKYND